MSKRPCSFAVSRRHFGDIDSQGMFVSRSAVPIVLPNGTTRDIEADTAAAQFIVGRRSTGTAARGDDLARDDVRLRCATCGRKLQGDRDDDPRGDDGPTCGECARERDFVLIDLLDGELDGHLN